MRTIDELGISPTPWCVDRWNDINDTGGYTIASVMDSEGCDKAEEAANARLIAAAPELYETLSEFRGWVIRYFEEDDESDQLLAASYIRDALEKSKTALAKASGEEVK